MVVVSFLVDLSVCLSRTVMGSPNAFPGCSVPALLNQFCHHIFNYCGRGKTKTVVWGKQGHEL